MTHQPLPTPNLDGYVTCPALAERRGISLETVYRRLKRLTIPTYVHPLFPQHPLVREADAARIAAISDRRRRRQPARITLARLVTTGQAADAAAMSEAGWQMSFELDGYGRLFGRWADGADPAPLVSVEVAT